ncbi:unnamed protein product [Heterobilharzia americana]|nr:unnamed protein product [Heterobilharzia americana]
MSTCVRSTRKFLISLGRKKTFSGEKCAKNELKRCLTVYDLTALGVGTTLGAGVYILVGDVARTTAGPGVILSFLVAAVASILSGLCYAEFGARVPQSGSAYIYSYITVGEIMAFIIGWNLILEYIIGTASVARAWSSNFDGLLNGQLTEYFSRHMSLNLPGFAEYVDPLAVATIILVTILLSVGVKESTMINNIFTVINLCVITFIIIAGLIYADINNWRVNPADVLANVTTNYTNLGTGGFLPFGMNGVLSGAGTCFFAFVGFDIISTTGEEVRNPQKAIPISIIGCLLICFLAYGLISATITLMLPYYALSPIAPLPLAFSKHGLQWAKYVISTGALCALTTSLLGSMFPLPRILYAMATDGLLFHFLGRVNARFKTPLIGTIISGVIGCIMAGIFSLQDLVDMMSIGTLLAYTLVSVSVLLLRGQQKSVGCHDVYDSKKICITYDPSGYSLHENQSSENIRLSDEKLLDNFKKTETISSDTDKPEKDTAILSELKESCISVSTVSNQSSSSYTLEKNNNSPVPAKTRLTLSGYFRMCFKPEPGLDNPTAMTEMIYNINSYLLFTTIFLGNFGILTLDKLPEGDFKTAITIPIWIFVALMAVISIIICVILAKQPENQTPVSFKVPGVPWIPALSIFINVYLMVKLSGGTWVRFLVWMVIGFLIYFGYGYWKSSERKIRKPKV